jgi:hypothetical protein
MKKAIYTQSGETVEVLSTWIDDWSTTDRHGRAVSGITYRAKIVFPDGETMKVDQDWLSYPIEKGFHVAQS